MDGNFLGDSNDGSTYNLLEHCKDCTTYTYVLFFLMKTLLSPAEIFQNAKQKKLYLTARCQKSLHKRRRNQLYINSYWWWSSEYSVYSYLQKFWPSCLLYTSRP